jgi:hypothetical protein
MNNIDQQKQLAHTKIDEIYEKYTDNEYMLTKINSYMSQLPSIIENMERLHIERTNRIRELSTEQDNFIQYFLNNNQYFYVSSTELFFYYDGLHYYQINEDDILYQVLSTISKDRSLMSWKQRTKINIMKRIKENSLLASIPESDTIQFVLDLLCPLLFANRTEAKYFLTILGDNILRKNINLIHFIYPKSKHFLQTLNNICQSTIGVGLAQTFKHKYYEHDYQDCRLVKINETVKSELVWNSNITQYVLDIICVACHYSMRYKSSDEYLIDCSNDNELLKSVFFMKDIQPSDLIGQFIGEYLDINNTQEGHQSNMMISWKNMQYLWKQFLESKNLPSIVFMQTLKQLVIEQFKNYYKEEQDSFVGIYSKHLPAIQKFLSFWNETMIYDETETDLEIEEIIILFKKWCQIKGETPSQLNDKQILDLLINYYPSIEIEHDKYISKTRSVLWDKQMEIELAMDKLKELIRYQYNNELRPTSPGNNMNYSIYDAYSFYCKLNNSQNVSKSYFEKYIFDNFNQYIVDSKFLSCEWYML